MAVKLGIEIEYACKVTERTNRALSALNGAWVTCSDGSVKCKHLGGYSICSECRALGIDDVEFKTAPNKPYVINLNDIDGSVKTIADDFKKILDTLEHVSANKSCGIHFHFSGIKKWQVFYSDEFLNELKAKYSAFCTNDIERARFNSLYAEWCAFNRPPQNGERYRALNIKGAYEKHKTFEFRFFASTEKIETLKRYLRFVMEILRDVKNTTYDEKKISVPMNDATELKKEIKIMI